MCIYTLKIQKYLKKKLISQWGCATLPNVLKLGVSGIKDIGYEPADHTVHPPPQKKTIEGGFILSA